MKNDSPSQTKVGVQLGQAPTRATWATYATWGGVCVCDLGYAYGPGMCRRV
jgi:hypothetical protein